MIWFTVFQYNIYVTFSAHLDTHTIKYSDIQKSINGHVSNLLKSIVFNAGKTDHLKYQISVKMIQCANHYYKIKNSYKISI